MNPPLQLKELNLAILEGHTWVTLVGSSLRSNGFPPVLVSSQPVVMGGRVAESSCTPSCLGLCGQVRAAGWAVGG